MSGQNQMGRRPTGNGPVVTGAPQQSIDSLTPEMQEAIDTRAAAIAAGRSATAAIGDRPKQHLGSRAALKNAMGRLKVEAARAIVDDARAANDPDRKILAQAGIRAPLPATRTQFKLEMPDPTVVLENGVEVGTPGFSKKWVPRVDMSGNAGDTRINQYQRVGYEPVRWTQDDPDGKHKAGDIVDGPLGVLLEVPAERKAQIWAANHPTNGVDAKAYWAAQGEEVQERNPGLRVTPVSNSYTSNNPNPED